jgi:uncharacterized FAD-dependent dehydrogenase
VMSSRVVKRSIDARGRRAPRFQHIVELELPAGALAEAPAGNVRRAPDATFDEPRTVNHDAARPIVIGLGPCGIFAALRLALAGLRPIVVDRGKPVETRAKDVARLMGKGILDPDSNLCFGEGGAGTWSDGKLYTRVGGPHLRTVLETIVAHGGPERILVDARPHLGTDRLVKLLKTMRATLIDLGADVRFSVRVERLRIEDGSVTGVELSDGTTLDGTHVVLAPGHSARKLYRSLAESRVKLTPVPFSVGFRVEHPQALVNEVQYGSWAGHEELPPAYYELKSRAGNADVYSFCMCPGGSVVPTPTNEGEVCVNGMSHAARSGRYANSAVVVSVTPEDYRGFAEGPDEASVLLAGAALQSASEREAWRLGGGAFVAPGQRLVDFLGDRPSSEVRRTTYKRGVTPSDLATTYPPAVIARLREGMRGFERKFRGWATEDAVLIGVETRTSSPVRIDRDPRSLESVNVTGLYPSGEGAGYGGGIVSAAIDGIKVADAILQSLGSA